MTALNKSVTAWYLGCISLPIQYFDGPCMQATKSTGLQALAAWQDHTSDVLH